MMFLYSLSDIALGALIVGVCTAIAIAAYVLLRPRIRTAFTDTEVGAAMAIAGAMATITSLLLAFSSISVWNAYTAAEASIQAEADAAAELGLDLAVYGAPAMPARRALEKYLHMVIDEEWPLLAGGQSAPDPWQELDRIFHEVGQIEPVSQREQILLPEVWTRLNDLAQARQDRLNASQAHVPGTLWAVVLLASALTLAVVFVLPVTRFSLALLASFTATLALVFFFIVVMDYPFAGADAVTPDPLRGTLTNMDRWDRTVAAPAPAPAAPVSPR
jgi:hypothetical protein